MIVTLFRNFSLRICSVLLFCILTGGCVSHEVLSLDSVRLTYPNHPITESELLDVGVVVFDPGIPEDENNLSSKRVFPEVRRAESRILPYNLRSTLASTETWGAVRVLPEKSAAVDLVVLGEILSSDGEMLQLKIQVKDNTGRTWLNKDYTQRATRYAYTSLNDKGVEPFQDLYDSITNDLLAARRQFTTADISRVRKVAELRYAADLLPLAFDSYLDLDQDGIYAIRRLPARNDPMLNRIQRIRSREQLFLDALDESYGFYRASIKGPYQNWRQYSYEEASALRELGRKSRARIVLGAATALVGGTDLLTSGRNMREESQIHSEVLQDLSNSVVKELAPYTVELEGYTVSLTGSMETQYEQWRSMLREIYTLETGFGGEESHIGAPVLN